MNYTENYQLPQWEESDRVLMADFNAAMGSIEAGLTGLEGQAPAVKLREQTVTTAANTVAVELTGVDFSAWPAVRLVVTSGAAADGAVGLRLNGLDEGYEYRSPSSLNPISADMITLGSYGDYRVAVDLRPFGAGTYYNSDGLYLSGDRITGVWHRGLHQGVAYSQLSEIDLVCDEAGEKIPVGTKIVIYGLKD